VKPFADLGELKGLARGLIDTDGEVGLPHSLAPSSVLAIVSAHPKARLHPPTHTRGH
jgi:hypothetical protein